MADIEVWGTRAKVTIKAIVDTGFDGYICMPIESAVDLGLQLWGWGWVELADGSEKRELIFTGFANFLGRRRKVKITLTTGDALIGTELMSDCQLFVDFVKEKVRITRPAR